MPQDAFLGKGIKVTVNIQTGEVFASLSASGNNSQGSGASSVSATMGWIMNLSEAERNQLGDSISNALVDSFWGVKGCYLFCVSGSSSIGGTDPKYILLRWEWERLATQ